MVHGVCRASKWGLPKSVILPEVKGKTNIAKARGMVKAVVIKVDPMNCLRLLVPCCSSDLILYIVDSLLVTQHVFHQLCLVCYYLQDSHHRL